MCCTLVRNLLVACIVILPLPPYVNASEVNQPVCPRRYIQPPQVGQRCITDTEIYINKTGIELQHRCMWLCIRNPICQVINFNHMGAYCLMGLRPCVSLEKEVEFITTSLAAEKPCLKWVESYENGLYNAITFPISDNTDPSDLLIVVRIRKGEHKIPGKGSLILGQMYTYYSWQGKEMEVLFAESQCEFLILSPECTISWVPHNSTSGNPLPTGGVIGGYFKGVPLYVARKFTVRSVGNPAVYSSGYYNNVEGRGHMPFGWMDMVYTDVEILVIQEWNCGLLNKQNAYSNANEFIKETWSDGSVKNPINVIIWRHQSEDTG